MFEVLVVEDEDGLRESVVRGIDRLDGVHARGVGSVNEAVALLSEFHPRLVISDIDMPGRPGIDLLGELGRRNLHVPVVFVTAYMRVYAPQIPRYANIDTLEKPVSLSVLRDVVEKHRASGASEEGAPFSLADYLQIACLGRHSVRIDMTCEGCVRGWLIVVNGQPWSARAGELEGEAALQALFAITNATVSCRRFDGSAPNQNLHRPFEQLLLDAARLMDEEKILRPAEVPKVSGCTDNGALSSSEDPFDAAWSRGVEALLDRDYGAALRAFLDANEIRSGEPRVLANISRLQDLKRAKEDPS